MILMHRGIAVDAIASLTSLMLAFMFVQSREDAILSLAQQRKQQQHAHEPCSERR